MENISSVGGEFWIDNNDQLTDLTPFENLIEIGSDLNVLNNATLLNLFGFENIDPGSINNLNIFDNPLLSDCDVQSICDYLLSPNGTVDIHNNATGCNSQGEVELACLTNIVDIGYDSLFTISPNPLESTTLIRFTLHQNSPVTLIILDLSGREIITLVNEVQQQGEQRIELNTSGLPAGIYFCVLKTNTAPAGQTIKMIKL